MNVQIHYIYSIQVFVLHGHKCHIIHEEIMPVQICCTIYMSLSRFVKAYVNADLSRKLEGNFDGQKCNLYSSKYGTREITGWES